MINTDVLDNLYEDEISYDLNISLKENPAGESTLSDCLEVTIVCTIGKHSVNFFSYERDNILMLFEFYKRVAMGEKQVIAEVFGLNDKEYTLLLAQCYSKRDDFDFKIPMLYFSILKLKDGNKLPLRILTNRYLFITNFVYAFRIFIESGNMPQSFEMDSILKPYFLYFNNWIRKEKRNASKGKYKLV